MQAKTRISRGIASTLAAFDAHPFQLVFVIGLALRLAAIAWLGNAVYDQGGDAVRYLSIAVDVLEGRPYGSTSGDYTRVPLYQFFLAAHLWLFGSHLTAVAVTQAVLGALTACVLGLIARDLFAGKRWWSIGLAWATYPPAILNTVILFPQTLQVFWLVLAFWLLISGSGRGSTLRCAGAGVCWGLASLSRSGPLLFLPVLALGPMLLRHLRDNPEWRWALRASLVMLVVGAMSVVWWTARDFTKTYRLEYLLLNGHERNAAALLLRPLEPAHVRLVPVLRRTGEAVSRIAGAVSQMAGAVPRMIFGNSPENGKEVGALFGVSTLSYFTPSQLSPESRQAAMADALGNVQRERRRFSTKLEQALGAPDGCVQLACTGPPQGYWAVFTADFTTHPIRTALLAVGRPCMVLKVLMYIQHYLFLLALVPAMFIFFRRAPGLAALLLLYVAYTLVGIVFATNYSETVAAVPRYAFALMPVVILVNGLAPFLMARPRSGQPSLA